MTFCAIPPKKLNSKRICDFVEPAIPADCFVQGFVGKCDECLNWGMQMMQDYTGIKEFVGFSSSPKLLDEMCAKRNIPYPSSYSNLRLFGYQHDILNEHADVCWIKVHFKSEVTEWN